MKHPVRILVSVACMILLANLPVHASEGSSGEPRHGVFTPGRLTTDDLIVEAPPLIEKGKEVKFKFSFKNPAHRRLTDGKGSFTFIVNGAPVILNFENGQATMPYVFKESFVSIYCDDFRYQQEIKNTPVWYFVTPGFAAFVLIAVAGNKRRRKKKKSKTE